MKNYVFIFIFAFPSISLPSATMEMQDTKNFEQRLSKQRKEQRDVFYSALEGFLLKIEKYEKFCHDKTEKQFLKNLKQMILIKTRQDKNSKAP